MSSSDRVSCRTFAPLSAPAKEKNFSLCYPRGVGQHTAQLLGSAAVSPTLQQPLCCQAKRLGVLGQQASRAQVPEHDLTTLVTAFPQLRAFKHNSLPLHQGNKRHQQWHCDVVLWSIDGSWNRVTIMDLIASDIIVN